MSPTPLDLYESFASHNVRYLLIGGAATYLNIVIFLALMGYFFSDDAMNALFAIFLVYAGYSVVNFLLLPMIKTFFI